MRDCYFVGLAVVLATLMITVDAGDMLRKSIVYDKNTPDVFYCPVHKPTGFDKMIVKAKPLSRLCQFEGETIPKDYKSDCYNDVDESEYACKEKYRIMMRLHPPGSDTPYNGKRLEKFVKTDKDEMIKKTKKIKKFNLHSLNNNQYKDANNVN